MASFHEVLDRLLLPNWRQKVAASRRQAEIAFRSREAREGWDQWTVRPGETSFPWMNAAIEYARTLVLAYAREITAVVSPTKNPEGYVDLCIDFVSATAYSKVHRYAVRENPGADDQVMSRLFSFKVRHELSAALRELYLDAWHRYDPAANEEARVSQPSERALELPLVRLIDAGGPASIPSAGCEWQDIELLVLTDHQVQFTVKGVIQPPLDYAGLGLGDTRGSNQGRPRKAWRMLIELARKHGEIPDPKILLDKRSDLGKQWETLGKRIEEICKMMLRQFPGIPGDPIPYCNGFGYRAAIRMAVAPTFEIESKDSVLRDRHAEEVSSISLRNVHRRPRGEGDS